MQSDFKRLLETIIIDDLEQDIITSGVVSRCEENSDGVVEIVLNFVYPNQSEHAHISQDIIDAFATLGKEVKVTIHSKVAAHKVQEGVKAFSNIKNIIVVASAKGGVGKSTVSVNLACALAQEGASVGLLDADIYGPSIPTMVGVKDKPTTLDGKTMEPIEAHGIKTMSIGYLIEANSAMIWRGPILTQTLTQLLNETNWGDIDYLIMDLPPGTGDTQLTIAQQIPVSGALVVTTPQEVALADARKGLAMFEKVRISVLGIVENMSGYMCPCCGNEEAIFSSGGGEQLARQYDSKLLGTLPVHMDIRKAGDQGIPIVIKEQPISDRYRAIARSVAATLSLKQKEYSGKFPKIVIE